MKITIYMTAVLLLLLSACQAPTPVVTEPITYPMQMGNSWNYLRTIEQSWPGPDSLPYNIDPINVYVSIERMESIPNYPLTYAVQTRMENSDALSENYYVVKEDGLYNVAYWNNGALPIAQPKSAAKAAVRFNNTSYASINELRAELGIEAPTRFHFMPDDRLIYEDPPLQTLKYPLQLGAQWIYREDYPWRMGKTVLDKKIVETPAGSFSCFEIKWLYDMDNNTIWDDNVYIIDHIAAEGLLKRTITFLGVIQTDEAGNEIGAYNYTETMTLTDYTLQDAN